MKNKKGRLEDIVKSMITNSKPNYRDLARGLTIAYNPTGRPSMRYTLSRVMNWPSDSEIQIVKDCLKKALSGDGRHFDNMHVEKDLFARGNRRYHVIHWEEIEQGVLL